MFIGHPACGFAAKRLTPGTSLGWLVLAPFFLDIPWPVYIGNFVSPSPPDVRSIAIVGLLLMLFPFWAWWADRHRDVR